jgi:Zn-finger nucleic acid-binding protein
MSTDPSLPSPASAIPMTALPFEGFVIYRDSQTGGHWLPRGALKLLAEHQLEQELPPLLAIDENTMHHSGRFCPEDGLELIEYEFAGSGLKIEQCQSCNGVWLDAGELKKLMTYLYAHSGEMAQPEDDDHLTLSERVMLLLYRMTERPPWV